MQGNRKHISYPLLLAIVVVVTSGSAVSGRYEAGFRLPRTEYSTATTLTMVFAGDIMAHEVNYIREPYDPIYQGIRDLIWDADFSFANLEFVFDPDKPPRSYPYFNAPVDYVEAAVRGGFNVFSLANNHSLDMGRESIVYTRAEMDNLSKGHRLYYSGTCTTPEERFKPCFFEAAGVRIGYLAVTSFLNTHVDDEYVNVVPYYEKEAVDAFIDRLSEETAKSDLFILSYHGGVEYSREPVEWKRELFRRFIDAGVDIVWGHHPHVVQQWETHVTPGGEKLILYSTGNLISGQSWTAGPDGGSRDRDGTGESALFSVEIVIRDNGVTAQRVKAVPIFNYRDPDAGMVVKRFDELSAVELSDKWALYYRDRLADLETQLFDGSSWSFDR